MNQEHVIDIFGDIWAVIESRTTKQGFIIYLGKSLNSGRGGKTVILTKELNDYLEKYRLKPSLMSLTIGRTTIKRLRKLLGHDWRGDNYTWWQDHVDDLASMTVEEFAARYNVSVGVVAKWRVHFFGTTNRAPRWWDQMDVKHIILNRPTLEAAEMLAVTASSIRRLRVLCNEDQKKRKSRINKKRYNPLYRQKKKKRLSAEEKEQKNKEYQRALAFWRRTGDELPLKLWRQKWEPRKSRRIEEL